MPNNAKRNHKNIQGTLAQPGLTMYVSRSQGAGNQTDAWVGKQGIGKAWGVTIGRRGGVGRVWGGIPNFRFLRS